MCVSSYQRCNFPGINYINHKSANHLDRDRKLAVLSEGRWQSRVLSPIWRWDKWDKWDVLLTTSHPVGTLRGGRWLDISVCGLQSQCIHSAVHVSQWGKVSRFIKRIDKLEPEQLLNITNFYSIPLVQFVVWFKNSSSKYQFAPLGGPLCCAVWRYFAGKVYWWPESWRNHIKNIIGLPASSAARTFYLTASLKPQDYGENAGVLYTLTLN